MTSRPFARCVVGTVLLGLCALAAPATADKPVTFPQLMDGYIKARIHRTQLPQIEHGLRFEREPAVYVAITPNELLVYGKTIHKLAGGRVTATAAALCAAAVPCLPAVRDAIAHARSQLGAALQSVPRVLILFDRRIPYQTLLLTVRSAAEAGAHLSIRLVGVNAAGALLELPVFAAPGRQHSIASAAPPGLITVQVTGESATITATRGYQPNGPVRATSHDGILQEIGQLQLASGRAAFFLAATANTTSGGVASIIARSRQMYRHVILMAPHDRPIVMGSR